MSEPPTMLRRKAWAAAGLSLLWPGLGYLYMGHPVLAAIGGGIMFGIVATLYGPVSDTFGGLLATLGALMILVFVFTVGAANAAQRQPLVPRGWMHRWYVYLIAWVGYIGALNLLALTNQHQPFPTRNASMEPALYVGELFQSLDIDSRSSGSYGRGQVVLFHLPDEPNGATYVKRIVALAGDRVSIVAGDLFVNGVKLERARVCLAQKRDEGAPPTLYRETTAGGASYLVQFDEGLGALRDMPELIVPDGHVFMLGDNRDNSADSRSFGTIASHLIVGEAQYVMLSPVVTRLGFDLRKPAPERPEWICADE